MKLFIVAVGHKMPNWVEAAITDYVKRMPKDSPIIIKELKTDINPAKEAVKILDHIPKNSYVIGLDERGKDLNTQHSIEMKELENQRIIDLKDKDLIIQREINEKNTARF
jgi:23S rRNA (pseudouridine1915-N3)-methyltransferase